jgi:hypothetical protein
MFTQTGAGSPLKIFLCGSRVWSVWGHMTVTSSALLWEEEEWHGCAIIWTVSSAVRFYLFVLPQWQNSAAKMGMNISTLGSACCWVSEQSSFFHILISLADLCGQVPSIIQQTSYLLTFEDWNVCHIMYRLESRRDYLTKLHYIIRTIWYEMYEKEFYTTALLCSVS